VSKKTIEVGPNRFRLRHDLHIDTYALDPLGAPVVLRCALCPQWSEQTTVGKRADRWQSHLRTHGGVK
jgi:hypothetical protein